MLHRTLLALCLAGAVWPALASDYRTVDVPVAILYDAPSQKGQKLYLIKGQTPVEVVVRLEGWVKVRDAEGTLAWIEAGALSEKRSLVVTAARAEIRQADNPEAPVLAELDKWVAVDWLGTAAPGWVRVKHRDGATGFIRSTQVWGL
ncbi:MAG: SH3 domain-containing protein [Dechloromonas sp.]|nr:MAG: SH3 domain-containing protein [Dechloromonas sp.]